MYTVKITDKDGYTTITNNVTKIEFTDSISGAKVTYKTNDKHHEESKNNDNQK